jgi:uncharacterized protein YegL
MTKFKAKTFIPCYYLKPDGIFATSVEDSKTDTSNADGFYYGDYCFVKMDDGSWFESYEDQCSVAMGTLRQGDVIWIAKEHRFAQVKTVEDIETDIEVTVFTDGSELDEMIESMGKLEAYAHVKNHYKVMWYASRNNSHTIMTCHEDEPFWLLHRM